MDKKFWWQEQPLTISAIQVPLEKGSKAAFDEYVSKSNYNVEQLLHLFGSYDEDPGMVYYKEETYGKVLEDYIEHIKGSGIKVIAYTNTHCLSREKSAQNPEYHQLDKNGKETFGYDIFNVACVNPKGNFHKEIIEDLKGLCTHDIGGIFFDGPLMRDDGCYCDVCRADFEEKFGHSIYEATDLERLKFRVDIVTEHIRIAYETIKSINPNIALYVNNSALRPDVTGSNTRKVYKYVDLIGAEGGFYTARCTNESIWQTSAFMKHLECIVGDPIKEQKPMVNFISANDSGISEQLKTEGETALTYAKTLANGGNIWYGFHYDVFDGMQHSAAKKAQEFNKYILENKELYKASKTCARVALMWSENTANNYSSSVEDSDFTAAKSAGYKERGDHRKALFAFVDMLTRCHIQYDIVDETSIENGLLSKYDSLILPSVACLSDSVAEKIKTYVSNGGNIFANFDVAMYNEDGAFVGKSKLAEMFGMIGSPQIVKVCGSHSVMYKLDAENPIFKYHDLSRNVAASLDFKWDYDSDTTYLMETHMPKDSVYGHVPKERFPSIIEHKYGKGTAYYASGNFGETAANERPLAYRKIVKGFCEYTSRSTVECDDKGLYEVVLRRQKDKFLLHIVNLTGAMERPIEKVTPLFELNFKLNLEDFGIEADKYTLYTARGGKLSEILQSKNQVSFKLDKLNEYEVVVINKK